MTSDFLRGLLAGLMLEALVFGGWIMWGLEQRAGVAEANIQALLNELNRRVPAQPQAQPRPQPTAQKEEAKP